MDTVNNVKSPRRRISTTLAGISGVLFLAGCATNAPQDTWQAKGPNAQIISDLQWIVFPMAGVVGVLVLAFAAYTMYKYRDKGQPIPTQGHCPCTHFDRCRCVYIPRHF
jgi:cytochrome c oxidase subunit 2